MPTSLVHQRGLWLIAIALTLIAFAVQALEPVQMHLRYQREAILAGQLWRLFTGHLVHLGWHHLLLNLAGLWILVAGFGRQGSLQGRDILHLLLLMAGVGTGLLLNNPELAWYVGLSGVLHGMAVLLAVDVARRGERVGWLLLVGVLAKIAWEQWQGAGTNLAAQIGGEVIVDAHLHGGLVGLLIASLSWFADRLRPRPSAAPEDRRE